MGTVANNTQQALSTARPVLLVGPLPPPYGGVSIHVHRLVELLKDTGIPRLVLSTTKGGFSDAQSVSSRGRLHTLWILCKLSRTARLVHDHTQFYQFTSTLISLAYLAIVRSSRSAWILTLHDGTFPSRFSRYGPFRRFLVSLCLRSMDQTVVIGVQLRAFLQTLHLEDDRILLIKSFLPLLQTLPSLRKDLQEFLRHHRPAIIVVGAHTETYHFDVVASAFALVKHRIPTAGLVIVAGSFSIDHVVLKRTERLTAPHRDSVKYIVDLPYEMLLRLLQECDLFIRSAFPDGDGLSLREALMLGIRVVAADTGERPPEVLTYVANDPEDLASRVLYALGLPHDSNTSITFAREAKQNFQAILRLYQRAARNATGKTFDHRNHPLHRDKADSHNDSE